MGKYLSGVLNNQAGRVNSAAGVRLLAKISVTTLMVTLLSFVGQGGGGLAGGSGVLAASRSSATPSSVAPCHPCVSLCRAGRSSRVVPSQCFVQFCSGPSSYHSLCSLYQWFWRITHWFIVADHIVEILFLAHFLSKLCVV